VFFRRVVTKRNGKKYTYLKLIESYREGGKVKQRVIANLGNIDHLDPEKVNSLISSLNKLSEPDTIGAPQQALTPREHQSPRPETADLHHLWQRLGLPDFLGRTITGKSSDKASWLVKAMVFQKLLFPSEHRPIAVSYSDLNFPELQGYEIPGVDFYQAAVALAGIKEQLENHLFEALQRCLGTPSLLYTSLIRSEYVGNECGLNTTGTAYQIRPYRQPVNLLVTIFPPGIPVSCSVCDKKLETKDITSSRDHLSQRLGVNTCMVINYKDFNFGSPTAGDPFIRSLPPEDFGVIPVSTGDLWQDRDAFTVNNTLWVKDIAKPGKRYIICHDLHPNAAPDRALEQTLTRAAQELDKIRSLVRQGRLRRQKTITNRINEVLGKYECQGFFHLRLNLESQDFNFSRNEEVIHKLKTLRRTQVLETNLRALPAMDIVNVFQHWGATKEAFKLLNDPVKIPVMYPFTRFQHAKDYITGQALIHMLVCTLKKLVSKNGGK